MQHSINLSDETSELGILRPTYKPQKCGGKKTYTSIIIFCEQEASQLLVMDIELLKTANCVVGVRDLTR